MLGLVWSGHLCLYFGGEGRKETNHTTHCILEVFVLVLEFYNMNCMHFTSGMAVSPFGVRAVLWFEYEVPLTGFIH